MNEIWCHFVGLRTSAERTGGVYRTTRTGHDRALIQRVAAVIRLYKCGLLTRNKQNSKTATEMLVSHFMRRPIFTRSHWKSFNDLYHTLTWNLTLIGNRWLSTVTRDWFFFNWIFLQVPSVTSIWTRPVYCCCCWCCCCSFFLNNRQLSSLPVDCYVFHFPHLSPANSCSCWPCTEKEKKQVNWIRFVPFCLRLESKSKVFCVP